MKMNDGRLLNSLDSVAAEVAPISFVEIAASKSLKFGNFAMEEVWSGVVIWVKLISRSDADIFVP